MNKLKELLKMEEKEIQRIINQVEERLKNAPEGSLQVSKKRNKAQYFIYNKKDKKRSYLSKEDEKLICRLAQKSYDEKILRVANKRLKLIKRINKDYEENAIEKIYLNEHSERKKKICPVEIPWNQKLEKWMDEKYEGKEFQEGTPVIMTIKGERVRSKSEKILADYFFNEGIPYKYEKPLRLKGMGIVYPDFTFLSPETGEEIYWEHEGRMDDPAYTERAVRKIQAYENNDFYIGERLVLTYETTKNMLDMGHVRRLAKRYLMR